MQFVGLSQVQQRQGNLARLEAASLPNAAVSSTVSGAQHVTELLLLHITKQGGQQAYSLPKQCQALPVWCQHFRGVCAAVR